MISWTTILYGAALTAAALALIVRERRTDVIAFRAGLGVLLALSACGGGTSEPASNVGGRLPLRQVADVPLPGRTARFDYQSLDRARHRLLVANLDADRVTVVDVRRRTVVTEIAGVSSAHGVLAVPALARVFVTATATNELVALDARSYRVLARSPTGTFPDGIAYDPETERVFVSDKTGRTVTVVDGRSGRRVGTVRVGGEVGNVQYDTGTGRVLANVQSRDELAAIDPVSLRVVSRTRVPGCRQNHGLLIDARRRLAFVACEANARLVVLDLRDGRERSAWEVGQTPDVLAFDDQLRRLYVAAESGVVTVLEERGGAMRLLGRATLAAGAHTVAVDSSTHLVYFPLADARGRPVLRVMTPMYLTPASSALGH